MVRRFPRLLAPISLIVVALGVYLILHSTVVGGPAPAARTSPSVFATRRQVAPRRAAPTFYRVRSGDSLSAIAARTGVSAEQITALNPSLSAEPNSLQTGQRLRLRR